jgi:hypothetical protein
MSRSLLLLALLGLGSTLGCGAPGYQFKDVAQVNDPLPSDFAGRTVYKESAAARGDLADFVGHIVEIGTLDGKSKKLLERYVVADYMPPVQGIDPNAGRLYYSKVDQGFTANAKVSYLATLDVQVAANEMMEILVQDVALVALPTNKIDMKALRAVMSSPVKPNTMRCFVQGVRLASITYKKYTKLDVNEKTAYGETFQVNGAVYCSTANDSTDFKVSLDCVDLDELKTNTQSSGFGAADADADFARALAHPELLRPRQSRIISQ